MLGAAGFVVAAIVVDRELPPPPSPTGPAARAQTASTTSRATIALPPPRVGLDVRVTANGVTLQGAEVQLSDGSSPMLVTAMTDGHGIARFVDLPPGPYEIWARNGAAISPIARIADAAPGEQPDVELELEPATRVRGQVVATAMPSSSITVALVPIDVDHVARTTTVDEHGRFAIDGVPAGHWRIETSAVGYVQPADQHLEVTPGAEQLDGVVIDLVRSGSVTGSVIDAAGDPVANATIVLRSQGIAGKLVRAADRESATTTRVRWIHPLAGKRELPTHDGVRFGGRRAGSRPTECGQGHCGVDLGWQRGAIVHAAADGQVVAAYTEIRGEAGRYIAIDHGHGLRSYYMHLDELRHGLEVGHKISAGEPLGTVGSTGFTRSLPHLHFALTQERRGRTWYVDPEPTLRYAVVLPASRPFEPFEPAADQRAMSAALDLGGAASDPPVLRITTDAQGRFRIGDVEPGSYVAAAFASELAPGASSPFSVAAGEAIDGVIVALRPGATIRGRVLGAGGAIAGATITVGAGFGETAHKIATTFSDSSGEFVLRSLIGEVSVAVSAAGYGSVERTIAISDADRVRSRPREQFVLTIEDAELRGQVLAPDGGSPGVVALRVIDGPTRKRIASDASGRFLFDHVANGSYLVEVSSPDYPAIRVKLQSDRWKDIRLEQGGSARIELRDTASNAPLPGIRIDAVGPGKQTIARTSDGQGTVELRGLASGAWRITARVAGYAPSVQTVDIAPSRVATTTRLVLARGATIAGVVRDRYGRRVPGARVSIRSSSTVADRDGNFRLVDVPAGTVELEAERDGARGVIALELTPGAERLSLNIELIE
ncbi:MAG: carboxypeptidase regulatory-like domain-containing protein [Kofleriaceae bacterium]